MTLIVPKMCHTAALARPQTMRAAILVEQRKPLVLDTVELPEELAHGQVLVRLSFSGVCGSQIGEIDGVKGEDRYLPHLLGHEGSGHVVEAGPGVRLVKPGDAVVLHWMKGPGIEAATACYRWNGRPLNAGWVTTFNEYAVVSENRLTAIPGDFDLEEAALFGCAITTGLGVVKNNARLSVGESVVVFGAGGVGLNVVQGAAMVSAWPIIAVDLFDAKLELARRFGATHTINARGGNVEGEIRRMAGAAGIDVAVDTTGCVEVIGTAYRVTHGRGRTVLVGVPRAGQQVSLHTLPLHFGKVLTGSHGGETQPAEDIPRYVRLAQAGKLEVAAMITDRFGLEEINEVLEQMRCGSIAGRCVVDLRGHSQEEHSDGNGRGPW